MSRAAMQRRDGERDVWRISVDTGGTFTDCLGLGPDGTRLRVKVLSTGRVALPVSRVSDNGLEVECASELPGETKALAGFELRVRGSTTTETWRVQDVEGRRLLLEAPLRGVRANEDVLELSTGEPAPVVGVRLLTGCAPGQHFPTMRFRLATTRATNSLLEGKAEPTALFITQGFGDLPVIRDQRRPDLFALRHQRPRSLAHEVVEVNGRLAADGTVVREPDWERLEKEAVRLAQGGMNCAAICLLHAHVNSSWEERLVEICRRAGFAYVAAGAGLTSSIGLLGRCETSLVEAGLGPILRDFIEQVESPLQTDRNFGFRLMTSAGGLRPRDDYRVVDSLLSGPAAGVVGAMACARDLGVENLITFDMGGTSTDVARCKGRVPWQFEHRVGDARLLSPSVRIHTVAAGGGSICQWKPGGLAVGPESAGADPGPACYGRGGPLTVTDVNLLLGRIDPDKTPFPLHRDAAETRLTELIEEVGRHQSVRPRREEFLRGLLELAVETMASAIRAVSVREGADPRDYALLAFGGAGPQHACGIADKLGIRRVLAPDDAGLLSAVGLDVAKVERMGQREVLRPLPEVLGSVAEWIAELECGALAELERDLGREGDDRPSGVVTSRLAEVRLLGQDSALPIEVESGDQLEQDFCAAHEDLYGYRPPENRTLELVSLRVAVAEAVAGERQGRVKAAGNQVEAVTPVTTAETLTGPFSTLVVEPGWTASWTEGFGWDLERTGNDEAVRGEVEPQTGGRPDAVEVELFRHRFAAVVEEMGALLRRTAISTNIKERLDFSCAMLDSSGRLLVNAPHIPVHLGALGECVRRCADELGVRPGETWLTNHPAFGGSHLPDVTLITPVFVGSGIPGRSPELLGYVANRAHHAEIGGSRPGSMPPDARRLTEEGVVLEPQVLTRDGMPDWEMVRERLGAAEFPSRRKEDNLADLAAQFAANRRGALAVNELTNRHGTELVRACSEAILRQGAEAMSEAIARLPETTLSAEEKMDDETPIKVDLARRGRGMEVWIRGGCDPHPGNLNATPAIVRSALLYALRLWLRIDLPLNEGILAPVKLNLERCFLNPEFPDEPGDCPAVVGGNVETSQRLVDTILKALGIQACSQGTMNNVLFGDDTFGYYETIGGGAGADSEGAGANGLHTHMTNTAITDPEILEYRYPVRLRKFSLRCGSGGTGRHRGGDGLTREYEFLRPLSVSLLTQHRTLPPYGLDGGGGGACGRQSWWSVADGREWIELDPISRIDVQPGDRLVVETPGGGGWGRS